MVRRTDEELRDIKGQRCSNRQINGKTETSRQKKQKEKVGVSKQGVFVHAISRLKKSKFVSFECFHCRRFMQTDTRSKTSLSRKGLYRRSSIRSFVRSESENLSIFFCFSVSEQFWIAHFLAYHAIEPNCCTHNLILKVLTWLAGWLLHSASCF